MLVCLEEVTEAAIYVFTSLSHEAVSLEGCGFAAALQEGANSRWRTSSISLALVTLRLKIRLLARLAVKCSQLKNRLGKINCNVSKVHGGCLF